MAHAYKRASAYSPELVCLLRGPSVGGASLHVSLRVDQVMVACLTAHILLPGLGLKGQAGLVQHQSASLWLHNHLGGPR